MGERRLLFERVMMFSLRLSRHIGNPRADPMNFTRVLRSEEKNTPTHGHVFHKLAVNMYILP